MEIGVGKLLWRRNRPEGKAGGYPGREGRVKGRQSLPGVPGQREAELARPWPPASWCLVPGAGGGRRALRPKVLGKDGERGVPGSREREAAGLGGEPLQCVCAFRRGAHDLGFPGSPALRSPPLPRPLRRRARGAHPLPRRRGARARPPPPLAPLALPAES